MGYRRGKSLSKDMEKQSYERETAVGTTGMVVSPHSVATDIGGKDTKGRRQCSRCSGSHPICFKRSRANDDRYRRKRIFNGI